MDNREIIERALAGYVITGSLTEQVKWDALADQAIAIECEVEHLTPVVCHASPYTAVTIKDDDGETHWISLDGLQGREGKAVAIIMAEE